MKNLIQDTLQCIFPEADKLEIIGDDKRTEGFNGITAGIREVVDRRAKGDLRPIVIYGFDSLERLKQREGGAILSDPGVYYLKLPALLSHIESILRKAASFKVSDQVAIDDESIRDYAIQKIRIFKHTSDNVWMSMSSNANRAKKALVDFPNQVPGALSEFKSSRIEKLLDTYTELEPMAMRLELNRADRVAGIMHETIEMIEQIQAHNITPQDAVDLAFKCVQKIKTVSDILAKAKELENSD